MFLSAVLVLSLLELLETTLSLTLTNGHCEKNISVKYQVPVTKTRLSHQYSYELRRGFTEQYVEYEERMRLETIQVCCAGYRSIIFDFCEPICEQECPANSHCVEPNKCACLRGYEPSHNHHASRNNQLICRPICTGGCPPHSHCVQHNKCECRPGFWDTSNWFTSLHCERIQCAGDQRYDVARKMCVKIEMTVEELMRKVAEKLARGLPVTDSPDSSEEEYVQSNELDRRTEQSIA